MEYGLPTTTLHHITSTFHARNFLKSIWLKIYHSYPYHYFISNVRDDIAASYHPIHPLFPLVAMGSIGLESVLTPRTRFANKAENREVCIFDSPRIAFYTLFLLLSYDTKECRHLTTWKICHFKFMVYETSVTYRDILLMLKNVH